MRDTMVGVGVGVGDDHFSFPVVSNPVVSHLSTPLWQIASRVYHHDEAAEKAGDKVEGSIVLEGSAMEEQSRRQGIEVVVDSVEEEKIDMLWEDFFRKEEKPPTEAILMEEEAHSKPDSLTRLCLPGGGRAPLGGGLVALVAVVKLLKKMFLISNNSAHHHQPQVKNKRSNFDVG